MNQQYPFVGFPEKLASWRRFLPYALLLSVTSALFGITLYFQFVWDDVAYVTQNYRIQGFSPEHLRAIWTQPHMGYYAPLHNSFLAILYFLSGLQPFGYHLAQFLLHAACVCLLYFVLKNIESARVALLASLLFAVYPPNIETVAWVSETKSTLAFLFFLLSFWFFLRLRTRGRWPDGAWCALLLVLSLLCKINTVVAPVIFLLYDYKQEGELKKERAWSLGFFFLISIVFTGIHLAISRQTILGTPDRLIDAALPGSALPAVSGLSGYYGGVYVHLLNLPRFLLFYMRMLIYPYPLSAWQMFRVYGELNWITGAAWIAILGLLWLLYRSPRDLQFWQLWFYVFLAPVLQIVPNAIWVADRYLYIPAIGAFVLWSKLFFHALDSHFLDRLSLRLCWKASTVAILLAFAWQTQSHLMVWRDDLTLWEATAKTCPTSAFCHNRLGQVLLWSGHPNPALREFYRAVEIRPAPLYLINLADTYADNFGDYPRAILAYQVAQQNGGGLAPAAFFARVAKTYYLAGDLKQASRAIEAGRKVDPDYSNLLVVSGFIEWKLGHSEQARQSLQRVLARNTMDPDSSNAAKFINFYWQNPAEVGQLLNDLGPLKPESKPERQR